VGRTSGSGSCVRSRRSGTGLPAVTVLAFGCAALTVALLFLPGIGWWFEFVHPIAAFLVTTELVKRFFYAHVARMPVL
jgi:membrane protein implicated in regulation of membrane protease activity